VTCVSPGRARPPIDPAGTPRVGSGRLPTIRLVGRGSGQLAVTDDRGDDQDGQDHDRALADWNLVVGFAFIIGGVVLSTKWR